MPRTDAFGRRSSNLVIWQARRIFPLRVTAFCRFPNSAFSGYVATPEESAVDLLQRATSAPARNTSLEGTAKLIITYIYSRQRQLKALWVASLCLAASLNESEQARRCS